MADVKPEILDFREVKTYRRHNCERRHRSETTFIECVLGKKLNWVNGVGQYASISWCNGRGHRSHYVTAQLHPTLHAALAAKEMIDYSACGGLCERNHEVVRVDLRGIR